jgi:hypothetical protein
MDETTKKKFLDIWNRFFPGAELPIVCYYTDDPKRLETAQKPNSQYCVIGQLNAVRRGAVVAFNVGSIGCSGGKRYFGYKEPLRENFEYFLSCGIPGELEGERYKKSPQIVRELLDQDTQFSAPAERLLFKGWDMLDAEDEPEIVIFFAEPDVLSGLFTLSGYDEAARDSVIAPFSAGCGSIVKHPYVEMQSGRCRSVIGMFDVSARPYVPAGVLSFAAPWPRFIRMLDNAAKSFLITDSWAKIQNRIARSRKSKSPLHLG